MPHTETSSSPRKHGQFFVLCSYVATASLGLILLAAFGVMRDVFMPIGFVCGTLSVIIMYATRGSDEWIAALWSAGASAGFVGAMAWLVLAPFVEGFYDGLTGNESGQDLPASTASVVALAAFVLALNLKRIRGY